MKWNRIRFSKEASETLGRIKGRTGVTHNLLSRFGFMLSINDPIDPSPDDYDSAGHLEIDRKTLTGEYDLLITAILKERHPEAALHQEVLIQLLRAHMNRGALLLAKRVKTLADLGRIIPETLTPHG